MNAHTIIETIDRPPRHSPDRGALMEPAVTLDPIGDPAEGDLVLFDLIEFGFLLRLRQTGARARARLVAGLRASGLLRSGHPLAGRCSSRLTCQSATMPPPPARQSCT